MSEGCTGFLSSHSLITLSRCCSLRGSILSTLIPTHWPGLGRKAVSAAQCAPQPVRSAAHAKASDTKPRGILYGSLADEHPDLALQWVPERNGSQTPESVSAASGFTAAWRCGKGCEHCGEQHDEWSARVADRARDGTGCPLCSGHKICRCRSVAALHPELMKQWDWESNQGIDPYSIACQSNKKLFWICAEHGAWNATPNKRVRYGQGCPECAKQRRVGQGLQQRGFVKDDFPDVYAELHPTKNAGVDIEKLTCGSNKRVWWLCQSNLSRPEGCQHEHEWEAKVHQRCNPRRPSGCPFCKGSRVCPCKSIAVLQPNLMQYWDSVRNAIPLQEPLDPSQISEHSHRKVWWRHESPDGRVHHWRAKVLDLLRCYNLKGRVPCPDCAAATRAATYAERSQGPGCRQLIKRT